LLGSAAATGRIVVADFEAGIGTLTRMAEQAVDVVVIVTEPTVKSIEVAARAAALARARRVERIVLVANRVREDADLQRVREALDGGADLVAVPDDPAVREADREGLAPIDHAPEAPAVRALVAFAERFAADGHG
jgi:CO dehydrogenase maturation factor